MEFLQPLSPEEEMCILERIQLGDEEAKSLLVEHNMRLVAYVAQKYTLPWMDVEDLISIGTIGLIKAVQTFDVTKNIKFATYGTRCIQNEIFMHFRKTKNKLPDIRLDDFIECSQSGKEIVLLDVIGTAKEMVETECEKKEDIGMLYILMEELSKKEKTIIEYRFGINREKKKQEDIAEEFDISQSYVSRIEKRAIKKMQQSFQRIMNG